MNTNLLNRFSSNSGTAAPLGGIAPYPPHPDLIPRLAEPTPPTRPDRYTVRQLAWLWGRRGRSVQVCPHRVILITREWVYLSRTPGWTDRRIRLDRHVIERDGRIWRKLNGKVWMFMHPGWPSREKGLVYNDLRDLPASGFWD